MFAKSMSKAVLGVMFITLVNFELKQMKRSLDAVFRDMKHSPMVKSKMNLHRKSKDQCQWQSSSYGIELLIGMILLAGCKWQYELKV